MLISVVATISPLWYISRAAGFVGLVLLGVIGVLGVMTAGNFRLGRGARFLTPEMHRSLTLLAVVVLGIHVGAAVLDPFARIGFKDIVVPFGAHYRPIWVGIGAVAIDLGIAVVATSLLRVRMGYRSWKLLHWASYPIFALSIVHGLGTGSDSALLLSKIIYLLVGAVLLLSILARLISNRNIFGFQKLALLSTSFGLPLLIVAWAFIGPFGPNWPKRAAAGLGQSVSANTAANSASSVSKAKPVPIFSIGSGYSSSWSGKIDSSPANSQGEVALRLIGPLSGSPGYELSVTLIGFPQEGGISMASSILEVANTQGTPFYEGKVTTLSGTTIVCQISNVTGSTTAITINLNLSSSGTTFTGTVAAP